MSYNHTLCHLVSLEPRRAEFCHFTDRTRGGVRIGIGVEYFPRKDDPESLNRKVHINPGGQEGKTQKILEAGRVPQYRDI